MTIKFPHPPQKHGGPGSFQSRLEKALKKRGWTISYFHDTLSPDVILVVGGTRQLIKLHKYNSRGIPVIYRLDGINWLHKKSKFSLWPYFYNEVTNLINQIIRYKYATTVIYQSAFVEKWWNLYGWETDGQSFIIHNGVDIADFSVGDTKQEEDLSILCVEGTLDYSPYAVDLLNQLQEKLINSNKFSSIILYGGFNDEESKKQLHNSIDYRGRVSRDELPGVYKNSIYLSLDVNAACPNTVIEAMASGLPVIGYDTGALKELLRGKAGEVAKYGSDEWELGFPDVNALCEAALKVKRNWVDYSKSSREVAEKYYDLNDVVEKYVEIIKTEVENSKQ